VVPELVAFVQVAACGHRDLQWVWRQAARLTGLTSFGRVDDQPRIVAAQRGGPDQDGVGLGADLALARGLRAMPARPGASSATVFTPPLTTAPGPTAGRSPRPPAGSA
jgi:hypothetical protein